MEKESFQMKEPDLKKIRKAMEKRARPEAL